MTEAMSGGDGGTPLAIDLYCGLGGWSEGLLAEGWHVIGFDIERHQYGDAKYPAQLVLQDALTIHGRQFKDAALIVASPPCQEYSYMAMPWSRAKAIAAEYRSGVRDVEKLTALFDACFRIQREAIAAAGHFIPLVVENVRGACPWVGRSRWNYGSFHLWGDVPALLPMTRGFAKVGGFSWSDHGKPDYKPLAFNGEAERRMRDGEKTIGHVNQRDGHSHTRHLTNQPSISRMFGGKSSARKAASAAIAKIPFALSSHIARVWKPQEQIA